MMCTNDNLQSYEFYTVHIVHEIALRSFNRAALQHYDWRWVMTSRRLALYGSAFITAVCIISLYAIYVGDVIGLRHVILTTRERHVKSRTDVLCSTSGIAPVHLKCNMWWQKCIVYIELELHEVIIWVGAYFIKFQLTGVLLTYERIIMTVIYADQW